MNVLDKLITEARAIAGDHPCLTSGHTWETQGGRACSICENGSQVVFRCMRCGDYDYGGLGSMGYESCRVDCLYFEDGRQDEVVGEQP